jgi:enamine deaminase RidA (YjgF/YER057c/UK114 family)
MTDATPTVNPEARLTELGIDLPSAPAAAASYLPSKQIGQMLYLSGQVPFVDGRLEHTGRLGAEIDVPTGIAAARQSAINVLAELKTALGSLDRVAELVKITVFVAATPEFVEPHLVANGASDLFADVFGEQGRHARSAIGIATRPLGAPVEVEVAALVR